MQSWLVVSRARLFGSISFDIGLISEEGMSYGIIS